AGVGYDVYKNCRCRIQPVAEVFGWTVLNGFESVFAGAANPITPAPGAVPPTLDLPITHGVHDASGDTIINAKIGVRTYFGERSDVYFGYGHALTGEHWYKDIYRVEYRVRF